MRCDICNKDYMFLHFIGRDNVCTNCIAKHTVFREIKTTSEARLKKALRAFEINSFEDLKNITEYQIEEIENKPNLKKETIKLKKNKAKNPSLKNSDDAGDPMSEMDQLW